MRSASWGMGKEATAANATHWETGPHPPRTRSSLPSWLAALLALSPAEFFARHCQQLAHSQLQEAMSKELVESIDFGWHIP